MDKYKHIIKDKNTVSNWNITNITSVKLKLYGFMDLWDKATLSYACSKRSVLNNVLPSFVSSYDIDFLILIEKDNINHTYAVYEYGSLDKYK